MNLRFGLTGVFVLSASLGFSQNGFNWSFTLPQNDALTDAYWVETDTTSFFSTIRAVDGGNGSTTFTGGNTYAGFYSLGSTPATDHVFLNLIAIFSDSTGINVAFSMPTALGQSYVNANSGWTVFDAPPNFMSIQELPSEAVTLTDLSTATNFGLLALPFQYLTSSDPILASPSSSSMIVNFDGAENGGTFSYAETPEPMTVILFGAGAVGLLRRRLSPSR